jgi:hypothetical protein
METMEAETTQHYDPDTIKMMQLALNDVWDSLSLGQRAHSSKTRLASVILEAVEAGERDPFRLRTKAVTRFLGL